MDVGVFFTAFVPVVVVVLGFIFERWRDRKAKLQERKEDLYKELVNSLKGFFEQQSDIELRKKFVDETRLARLYASDEAIKALNNFLSHMMKDDKSDKYQQLAHSLVGEFLIAMRKDLGIKTKLSSEELGRLEYVKS